MDKPKPTYLVVPRKFVIAWIASFICSIIMCIVSVQWSAYINEKSNKKWCGIVVMFDDTYKQTPPPPDNPRAVKLAIEFSKLRNGFKC